MNNVYNIAYIGGKNAEKELMLRIDEILGESHDISEDFLSVPDIVKERRESDKNSPVGTSVTDVRNALEWSSIYPSGGVKVCYLGNLATLNAESSNALLKSMEESPYCMYVGYAESESGLLDTICSRMVIYHIEKVPFLEYAKKYAALELPERNLKANYILTDGEIELAEEVKEEAAILTSVGIYLNEGRRAEVLELLHLAKEDDADNYYRSKEGEVFVLFDYLRRIALERQLAKANSSLRAPSSMVAFLTKEMVRSKEKNYDKNDFFLAIAKLLG